MVNRKKLLRALVVLTLGYGAWVYFYEPAPTILSAHVGKTFEQVVSDSTYPVAARSDGAATYFQWTDITKPSVIIRFSDPRHGFTLPPTTFAAITYLYGKVTTISTSPMLHPLPFDEAVEVLAQLQKQFQAGGWQPWVKSASRWFDLTPEGRQRLHQAMKAQGWAEGQELVVPGKYAMIFRLKCTAGCADVPGPERYLIDIGLGHATDAPNDYLYPATSTLVEPPLAVDASGFDVAGVKLGMTAAEAIAAASSTLHIDKRAIEFDKFPMWNQVAQSKEPGYFIAKNGLDKLTVRFSPRVPIDKANPMVVNLISYELPWTPENIKSMQVAAIQKYGPTSYGIGGASYRWCARPSKNIAKGCNEFMGPKLSLSGSILELADPSFQQAFHNFRNESQNDMPGY